MAAVGRAFTAHVATPAIPRGRRVVGVAASLGSGVPPSRRRRDRPVRVFLVGRKADDVLATSAFYEILESWAARIVDPELGIAFVGAQGDPWDAQKDMNLALMGSALAVAAPALWQWARSERPRSH